MHEFTGQLFDVCKQTTKVCTSEKKVNKLENFFFFFSFSAEQNLDNIVPEETK